LKNKRYFFLPNRFITLALCLAFLMLFPACQKAYIWGIKREELTNKISRGDFSFLEYVDFYEFDIQDILDYSPGAAYYVSRIFTELGYSDSAEKLLALEWQKGNPPWKYQAAVELAEAFIKQERYEDANNIVRTLLKYHSSAYNLPHIKRLDIETLYWQEHDEELLKRLDEYYTAQGPDEWKTDDPEIILFKAVAAFRLKQRGWEDLFRNLFYTVEAGDLHSRAYLYLLYNKERLANLSDIEMGIFKAKSLMAEGSYKDAKTLLKQGITQLPLIQLHNTRLVADYAIACLKASSSLADAELAESIALQLTADTQALALEMAAKIYAFHNSFKKAQSIWFMIYSETADANLKQRAQWYMLKNAVDRGTSAVLAELTSSVPQWKDFDYFSDLLEEYISSLLWGKDFTTLHKLYLIFKDTAPHEVRAKLTYIVARLISLGYLKGKTLDSSHLSEQLSTKDGYYSFLAAHFLNTPAQALLGNKRSYSGNADSSDNGRFIFGFFDFGLFEEGYTLLSTADPYLEADTLFNLAKTLKQRGQYLFAIRVLGLLRSTEQTQLSKEEALIVYPIAYEEEIVQAAVRFGIDRYLFFALIRRESAFDKNIVSHAGAVGLTQLMPATAEDVARRIDLAEPDLTNPEQNALLGAFFMADLMRRFKSVPRALAAYNAGPTRIRNWENNIGKFPDDLYVEAIPILETRKFVKFVCTAAVYYSCLYDDVRSPSERIGKLFE